MEQQLIVTRRKADVEPLSAELLHDFHARGYTSPLPRGTHTVGRKRDSMRGIPFSKEHTANAKIQPLAGEIRWSHNLIILDHCNYDLQREFYIRMTRSLVGARPKGQKRIVYDLW